MKTIELLNSDRIAIVDDEDYKKVSIYPWYLHFEGYVESPNVCPGGFRYLHRFLMNPPLGLQVDHINHDPLDNRRINLRLASVSQNHANSKKYQIKGTSKYKGVKWIKNARKWQAQIMFNYKYIYLGLFESEERAAIAYDLAALKYFREFSRLNFPERITIE